MQTGKNKAVTYLLICAVALVWGIIVYRVFFVDPSDDTDGRFLSPKVVHEPFDQYTPKNDTFKLALNYRDPFVGKAKPVVVEEKVSAGPIAPPLPYKPPAPPLNWSSIKYSGYITNPKTKKLVAILTVNNKERMLGEGESLEGVKLLKNKKDSVLLSWMGKQKYIKQ